MDEQQLALWCSQAWELLYRRYVGLPSNHNRNRSSNQAPGGNNRTIVKIKTERNQKKANKAKFLRKKRIIRNGKNCSWKAAKIFEILAIVLLLELHDTHRYFHVAKRIRLARGMWPAVVSCNNSARRQRQQHSRISSSSVTTQEPEPSSR